MMRPLTCFLILGLVLLSSGCIEIGRKGPETTITTTSVFKPQTAWEVFDAVRNNLWERDVVSANQLIYTANTFRDCSKYASTEKLLCYSLLEKFREPASKLNKEDFVITLEDDKQVILSTKSVFEGEGSKTRRRLIYFVKNEAGEIKLLGVSYWSGHGYLDKDEDGLNDGHEDETNPKLRDSDSDGFWDGIEVMAKTRPADARYYPFGAPPPPTTIAPTTIPSTSVSTTLTPKSTLSTISVGTCFDGVQNQGEQGIDCGGPCRSCNIECEIGVDCGSPHYGKQYCEQIEGLWYVMQDWVTYACKNPGLWNASCHFIKDPRKMKRCPAHKMCLYTDFCPGDPFTRCSEARCILPEDECDWIICDPL